MEIHAPDRPVHGVRDFAVHIAIVTVGILIALGLDGLRETWREHRLIRETRAGFNAEFANDRHESDSELRHVTAGRDQLNAIVAAMPQLALEQPAKLAEDLQHVANPYYFFSANSWQSALSTGALAHMSPEEVSSYAEAVEGVRRYTQIQSDTFAVETRVFAMIKAHPRPTAAEAQDEAEALLVFFQNERAMAHVCPQMQTGLDRAIRASANH
ncbi:MAG: hypothetical protein V4555_14740 [Acidobacteriota bacterium]